MTRSITQRGGVGNAFARPYLVSGESVTLMQVAERINRSRTIAANRLKREQGRPGPVTWAGLERVA